MNKFLLDANNFIRNILVKVNNFRTPDLGKAKINILIY